MSKKKLLIFTTLFIMIISILGTVVHGASDEFMVLKKQEDKYLIYFEDLENMNFEFAFSNDINESSFVYHNSTTDTTGANIAYVDAYLKAQYFSGGLPTYIWVKTGGTTVISQKLIDIENARTEESYTKIQNITKRISINSEAELETLLIEADYSKTYYYHLESINASVDYTRLANLIQNMNNEPTTYLNLKKSIEANDLFNATMPTQWTQVDGMKISKPYNAQEDQQYILWIKDDAGNIDVNVLTAYKKTVTTTQNVKSLKQLTSALPVTFDQNTVLWIVLAILSVMIISVCIIKSKIKKSEK